MIDVNKTIYESWLPVCEKYATREALSYKGSSISYRAFKTLINRCAFAYRSLGLKDKDTILLLSSNIPEALAAVFAASQCGLRVAFLHPESKEENVYKDLRKNGAKLFVVSSALLAKMKGVIKTGVKVLVLPVESSLRGLKKVMAKKERFDYKSHPNLHNFGEYQHEDTRATSYPSKRGRIYLESGGATGERRTVILSDFALLSLIQDVPEFIHKNNGDLENTEMFAPLSLFHGTGLSIGLLSFLYYGGSDYLVDTFSTKDALEVLNHKKEVVYVGLPYMFQELVNEKGFSGSKLKQVRMGIAGGGYLDPALEDAFEKRVRESGGKAYLNAGYGLSETVSINTVNTNISHRAGSVGKAISGVEILILGTDGKVAPRNTPGEIIVAGTTLMNGYAEGEDPFVELYDKKYVKTGDIGKMDADGYLHFVSRKKRLIVRNGYAVYPLTVEKELSKLPMIEECAYLSRPLGNEEETCLFVHLKKGCDETRSRLALVAAIKKMFYDYVVPDRIECVGPLPRGEGAKIDEEKLWGKIL